MTTRVYGGWAIVAVDGEIGFQTAEQMRAALSEAGARSACIVVDCTLLKYSDSEFLSTLVNAYNHVAAEGGIVVIAGAPDRLARQLSRTGLDQVFAVYPTVAEAVTCLSPRHAPGMSYPSDRSLR